MGLVITRFYVGSKAQRSVKKRALHLYMQTISLAAMRWMLVDLPGIKQLLLLYKQVFVGM